jgi:hypothetical protein
VADRLGDVALGELDALAGGLEAPQAAIARGLFQEAIDLAGWGSLAAGAPMPWCRIRHGRPYGCSMVADRGRPELRFMLEPRIDRAGFIAGLRRAGVDLELYDAVADLCAPGAFDLWAGAAVDAAGAITWKLYLPLTGRGPEAAAGVAAAALERLGLAGAWPPPSFRPGRDLPTILGLDTGAAPRTKLYTLHRGARAAELSTPDGQALARAMLGDDRPIWWLECAGFAAADRRPLGHTLHLGIPRHIPDAAIASRRLVDLLIELGLDPAPYRAVAAPPRLHFVSIRRDPGGPRLAIYFTP